MLVIVWRSRERDRETKRQRDRKRDREREGGGGILWSCTEECLRVLSWDVRCVSGTDESQSFQCSAAIQARAASSRWGSRGGGCTSFAMDICNETM